MIPCSTSNGAGLQVEYIVTLTELQGFRIENTEGLKFPKEMIKPRQILISSELPKSNHKPANIVPHKICGF